MPNVELSYFEVDLLPICVDGFALFIVDREINVFSQTPFIHDSQFFISVIHPKHRSDKLLHADGTIQGAAYNSDNKPTGWYTSLSEVRAAVRRYRELNNPQPKAEDNGKEETSTPSVEESPSIKHYNAPRQRATDNWPPLEAYQKTRVLDEALAADEEPSINDDAAQATNGGKSKLYIPNETELKACKEAGEIAGTRGWNKESLPPQTDKTNSYHNDESHSE